MPKLHLYSGRTLAHVADLSSDVINMSYTIGLNGSASGNITVERTAANASLLNSLGENSHFLRFGLSEVYGGIVEAVSRDKNVYTIEIAGFYEYLAKIDAVASHLASSLKIIAEDSDNYAVKIFYADSPMGILYELLVNLDDTMAARGFTSFFDYSNLLSHITSDPSIEWQRSYRLNSLEVPSMQQVLTDVMEDYGMELLDIRTSTSFTAPFKITFSVKTSGEAIVLDEAKDSVFSVESESADVERRAFSIMKGTNLKDKSQVSRTVWRDDVAYSSTMASSPAERSGAITRLASENAQNLDAGDGTLTFSSYDDNLTVLDYVSIGSDRMDTVTGLIVEKSVEGTVVSYTIQIGEPTDFNASLRKPQGGVRKIIFKPLKGTAMLAKKTAGRKLSSTGWRS